MHGSAFLGANSLWTGEIVGECVAPRIHPDTPTDSLGFGNLKMITIINNFLTIGPARLRFSVLLDYNSIYIVLKR